MSRIAKTTATITTALVLAGGLAAPANADSAWPDVGERAGSEWTPGDGEPRPMDRSYFEDRNSSSRASVGDQNEAQDADNTGFFAAIIDAFERAGEDG
jgi:hypothetical protein